MHQEDIGRLYFTQSQSRYLGSVQLLLRNSLNQRQVWASCWAPRALASGGLPTFTIDLFYILLNLGHFTLVVFKYVDHVGEGAANHLHRSSSDGRSSSPGQQTQITQISYVKT